MREKRMTALYYIVHINNVPSILQKGILSHEQIKKSGILSTHIYDEQIVESRAELPVCYVKVNKEKEIAEFVSSGKTLGQYANLYFQPRNAMLYRILLENSADDIVIIALKPTILNQADIFITNGNAVSPQTIFLPSSEGRKIIPKIAREISRNYWSEQDGSKRKMMAECLVPDKVDPQYIQSIYVASHEISEKLSNMLQNTQISSIPEPNLFFQPVNKIYLTDRLSIVKGDMFFSRLQTLTVSVNSVGIMGRGLASRAKYQFPDIYVHYQDLCRKHKLKLGKPFLYKRESPFDYQLADVPSTLTNDDLETWFLLFPTKKHWRMNADIRGIEHGLQWINDNYKKENIKSLAIPALGCGLGKLQWRDVGPLLCKYLSTLDIEVWIYLPAEKKIPSEMLTYKFLLGNN